MMMMMNVPLDKQVVFDDESLLFPVYQLYQHWRLGNNAQKAVTAKTKWPLVNPLLCTAVVHIHMITAQVVQIQHRAVLKSSLSISDILVIKIILVIVIVSFLIIILVII